MITQYTNLEKKSDTFFPLKNFVRQKFIHSSSSCSNISWEVFPDMQVDNDPIFTSIANIITSEILILEILCIYTIVEYIPSLFRKKNRIISVFTMYPKIRCLCLRNIHIFFLFHSLLLLFPLVNVQETKNKGLRFFFLWTFFAGSVL